MISKILDGITEPQVVRHNTFSNPQFQQEARKRGGDVIPDENPERGNVDLT